MATNYDGQAVTWELGGGTSRRAFISGGLQPSNAGLVIGLPRAAGVVRRDRTGLPRARVQDAVYATYVGTVGVGPGQFGGIWNVGDARMLIVAINLVGPDADAFMPLLSYRGEVLYLDDAQARLPLSLAPGEAILVGGNFYATAVGTYRAALAIGANAANGSSFTVNLIGQADQDNRPPPIGSIVGPQNFGGVAPGGSVDRQFLITCDSVTPLVVRRMTIGDPFLIFDRFTDFPPQPQTYQIESGQSWQIRLTFHPQAAGQFHTVFTVETNGRQLTMDLYGEAG